MSSNEGAHARGVSDRRQLTEDKPDYEESFKLVRVVNADGDRAAFTLPVFASNEARECVDVPSAIKISFLVDRSLLSLGRDNALRHRYLRKRWQGIGRPEIPSSSTRHARAQKF